MFLNVEAMNSTMEIMSFNWKRDPGSSRFRLSIVRYTLLTLLIIILESRSILVVTIVMFLAPFQGTRALPTRRLGTLWVPQNR